MNAQTRRQVMLLGVLMAGLVLIVLWQWSGDSPAAGSAPPAQAGRASAPSNRAGRGGAAARTPVTDVKLEVLGSAREDLPGVERNPFRFQPKAPPPSPRSESRGPEPRQPPPEEFEPPQPVGPPPPPPIPLRFIGLVGAGPTTQTGRVAIFSDQRGNVVYGKEGDIIEGRYRVLRIGPDSADLVYLDGRGRQTLRLSGQ